MPIKIDPAWFPVPQTIASLECHDLTPPQTDTSNAQPSWEPLWAQAFEAAPEYEGNDDDDHDYAYLEDHPGWDDEPPEPLEDTITVKSGERVPFEAGELLRTYYAPGIGDVRFLPGLIRTRWILIRGRFLGQMIWNWMAQKRIKTQIAKLGPIYVIGRISAYHFLDFCYGLWVDSAKSSLSHSLKSTRERRNISQ